ncbi:uncharacterized protein LOC129597215 [Paramacrobiotus metropolitanus]|uniref:uncharacterized protein LOC129597215 n=1 Tax=Paramacrobiotus metropolitanus TaxID=2943436 RepID=UPI0024459021|nr:uncharacterized protein LOC129597215 [Paramacrobiotus metropolitanus]
MILNTGGMSDDQSRWVMECHDGEAAIGFYAAGDYVAPSYMWCKFVFPMKKPSGGLYPYYDYCNVRDLTTGAPTAVGVSGDEFYCYDKYYPIDTYDTFVTAYLYPNVYYRTGILGQSLVVSRESYKCCKLPLGYHLDYSRCMYKYSHDKWGEHYDENQMFLMKCDRDHLMTGIGKAEGPNDSSAHYVWIQCCPFFYNMDYVPLYATANATFHQQAAAGAGPRPYNTNYSKPKY